MASVMRCSVSRHTLRAASRTLQQLGLALLHFTRVGLLAVPLRDKGLRYRIVTINARSRTLSVAANALQDLIAAEVPSVTSGRRCTRRHSALDA